MGVSNSISLENDKPLINVTASFQTQEKVMTSKEVENDHDSNTKNSSIQMKSSKQQKVQIPVQIETLSGCDPIYLEFSKTTSIRTLQKAINNKLEVPQNTLQVIGQALIPQSFRIIVGDENRYDFGNKIFIIYRNTTFIEYFNDLLQAAKDYVTLTENEEKMNIKQQSKIKDNIKCKGNLETRLTSNILQISDISIAFKKTLRKSRKSNNKCMIPPILGSFDVVKVNNYIHNIPKHWIKRNGLIIGMWQKEALSLSFNCLETSKYAIKIAMDKVNVMNGNEWKSEYLSSDPINCAILSSKRCFLNGQFTAMPLGQSHDDTGIMMIEIYEKYNDKAHISINKEVRYSYKEYDKTYLHLTPIQAGFNDDDKVYIFSHEMPKSLWRECTVIDAMYANKDNIIYVYCNKKQAVPKWIKYLYDEMEEEFKSDYIIESIGYINEHPLEYKVVILQNGMDIKLIGNDDKKYKLYLKDNELDLNINLKHQGVDCGDMISKIINSNQMIIYIKTLSDRNIILNGWSHFTLKAVKHTIMEKYGLSFDEQVLMLNNNVLDDDNKRLFEYGVKNKDILHCVLKISIMNKINEKEEEINLIDINKQLIASKHNVYISRYNQRAVTRVFVYLVNGLMWKKITGKELSLSNIDPFTYKQYGYLWCDQFEEKFMKINNNKLINKKSPKMQPIKSKKNNDPFIPKKLHSTNINFVGF